MVEQTNKDFKFCFFLRQIICSLFLNSLVWTQKCPCSSSNRRVCLWLITTHVKRKEHSSASESTASVCPDSPCGVCIPHCSVKLSGGYRQKQQKKKFTGSYELTCNVLEVRMIRLICLEILHISLLLCSTTGLRLRDHHRDVEDDQELNEAILEMLHINKVSASHQAKPHPYMRRIYQSLNSLEAQDFGSSDGTLVQSYRSVVGNFVHLKYTVFIVGLQQNVKKQLVVRTSRVPVMT